MSSNFRPRISLFRGLQSLRTAPAQPHATEIAVYTALFMHKNISNCMGRFCFLWDVGAGSANCEVAFTYPLLILGPSDPSVEVVCPICASAPGGDPNLVTNDIMGHLTVEHRTSGGTRSSSSG